MAGKIIAKNRRAYHDYDISEKIEAGIVLKGTEVKSIRAGKVNFADSFARIDHNELFLYNMHISPYEYGSYTNVPAARKRKLLLHKTQIKKLWQETCRSGVTLVPLSVYFTERGVAKIEIGLARGKKHYDKRQALKKKDARREIERALRNRKKGI